MRSLLDYRNLFHREWVANDGNENAKQRVRALRIHIGKLYSSHDVRLSYPYVYRNIPYP